MNNFPNNPFLLLSLADVKPKTLKIHILAQSHLPTDPLKTVVVHSKDVTELVSALARCKDDILVFAFTSDRIEEVRPILSRYPVDTVYIINSGQLVHGTDEPWWHRTTMVHNDQQLMRYLCTKSMLCFYDQGIQHRQNGDFGLANLYLTDSLEALNYSATFIQKRNCDAESQ